jgi:pimeloyl-ACP methyl ester carboxylesterase
MTEPRWIDIQAPAVKLKALTWGPPDGPIALCLHGFPDTAYGWRSVAPRLADAGWRVVAPFMRGYAPSSIPSDGSYHIGALMDDALQVRTAAGGTERDVVIGHDWGAMAANGLTAIPDSPFAKAVIMSVPPVAAFRGRVPDAGRLLAQIPPQLLRSWYIMYFQLPWLPERSAPWVLPRLWSRRSPGYNAKEDLRHVDPAIGAPESWRAALGLPGNDSQYPPADAVPRTAPALDIAAAAAQPLLTWTRRRLHGSGFHALDPQSAS